LLEQRPFVFERVEDFSRLPCPAVITKPAV